MKMSEINFQVENFDLVLQAVTIANSIYLYVGDTIKKSGTLTYSIKTMFDDFPITSILKDESEGIDSELIASFASKLGRNK